MNKAKKAELTKEQLAQYEAVVDEFEKYRELTLEEKELLIKHIMSGTYMDLRCDWAFKHVMQDKKILKMLLNDVLPETVDEVELLPNEVDRFFKDDKNATMDVVCRRHNPEKTFIVEIQQQKTGALKERMMYYGAASLAKQVKRSESYGVLHPVYVICFLDDTLPHEDDKLTYRYAMREEDSHELYNNLLNIFFFELPRLQKESMKGLSPLEGWLYLLRNLHTFADVPEGMDERFNGLLQAAQMHSLPRKEKLQYLRTMISDFTKKDYYQGGYETGLEEGLEKGIEQGIVLGAEKNQKDNAKALLAVGVPAETIASALGMTIEEVQGLV